MANAEIERGNVDTSKLLSFLPEITQHQGKRTPQPLLEKPFLPNVGSSFDQVQKHDNRRHTLKTHPQ